MIVTRKLKLFNIVLICLLLVGCVSEKERNKILSELKASGIVKDSWVLTKSWSVSAAPVPGVSAYMYQYATEDCDYCIRIPSFWYEDSDGNESIDVTLYNAAVVDIKEYKQYDKRTESYIAPREYIISDYESTYDYTITNKRVLGVFKVLTVSEQ